MIAAGLWSWSGRKLTWNWDDWNTLIGHHSRRAAVLHIKMSRLETPPDTDTEKRSVCERQSVHKQLVKRTIQHHKDHRINTP